MAYDADLPKVLQRQITPAVAMSREKDTQETLNNYGDSLRSRGVSEDQIQAFQEGERSKMLQEYSDLDHGVADPYTYQPPTDWDATAASLRGEDADEDLEMFDPDTEMAPENEQQADGEEADMMPAEAQAPEEDEDLEMLDMPPEEAQGQNEDEDLEMLDMPEQEESEEQDESEAPAEPEQASGQDRGQDMSM